MLEPMNASRIEREDTCEPQSEQLLSTAAVVVSQLSALDQGVLLRERFAEVSLSYRTLAADRDRLTDDFQRGRTLLREVAREYGRCLKHEGTLPEHIVTSVRTLLIALPGATSGDQDPAHQGIASEVITWAIEGYYADA